MKKIIILMILTFSFISVHCYGFIYANWPCLLYFGQCPPKNSGQSSIQSMPPTLGKLSIEAAGFFLQANIDFQAFLKKVELSEISAINYDEMSILLNNSIENLESANFLYYQVFEMSKTLALNPFVMKKLKQLDYRIFEENSNFIPSILEDVKSFLQPGNMTGAFEIIYNDTGEILQCMKSLKILLDSNSIDIPQCWNINQRLLRSALFGQYISQVFFEIKKSMK